MEVITDILEIFLFYIGWIFYCFFLIFFGAEPGYTHIFKIVFLASVAFLIYTSFRPTKRRWIWLFVCDALFIIASLVLMIIASSWGNDVFNVSYFIISFIWGFILLIATSICCSRRGIPG